MRVALVLFLILTGQAQANNECTETNAFNLFYGEHRQLAYDIVGESINKSKISETLQRLNLALKSEKVPDWEFTDQVHRVLTTAIIKLEGQPLSTMQKQQLFDQALEEAYQFNLQYARKNEL